MRFRVASERMKAGLPERRTTLACLAVALALVGLLGVPRPVEPRELPLPRVERQLLFAQQQREAALAREAREGLALEVRAVGELFRRVGRTEAAGDMEAAGSAAEALRAAAAEAARLDAGRPLLALRALQTELFLEAVGERAGEGDQELAELGGTFERRARRAGWFTTDRFLIPDDQLAALFRVRWSRLTGLSGSATFTPTLNDLRLYYDHRLRHPDASLTRRDQLEAQLADVRALSALDEQYPGALASGVLLYQLGAIDQALESFRTHLRARPNGEWSLRARNYATACAAALFER